MTPAMHKPLKKERSGGSRKASGIYKDSFQIGRGMVIFRAFTNRNITNAPMHDWMICPSGFSPASILILMKAVLSLSSEPTFLGGRPTM